MMDINNLYNWTFWNIVDNDNDDNNYHVNTKNNNYNHDKIIVSASMLKIVQEQNDDGDVVDDDVDDDGNNNVDDKQSNINAVVQTQPQAATTLTPTIPIPITTFSTTTTPNIKTIKYFTAYFNIQRTTFTPIKLCYYLIKLPIYCIIIQIWIHYQAFMLFLKGVTFIPHPNDKETKASQIVAFIMIPLFKILDFFNDNNDNNNNNGDDVNVDKDEKKVS